MNGNNLNNDKPKVQEKSVQKKSNTQSSYEQSRLGIQKQN